MKSHALIELGPIRGLAEYIALAPPKVGWVLRLEIGEHAIEGWGLTQDEAKFMFLETCKQWLKNTSRRIAIR